MADLVKLSDERARRARGDNLRYGVLHEGGKVALRVHQQVGVQLRSRYMTPGCSIIWFDTSGRTVDAGLFLRDMRPLVNRVRHQSTLTIGRLVHEVFERDLREAKVVREMRHLCELYPRILDWAMKYTVAVVPQDVINRILREEAP